MGSPEPSRRLIVESTAYPEPSVPVSVRLGSLLAWLGFCDCMLLLRGEAGLRSWLCPVRGGCDTVLGSQYAELKGVPLPWLGAACYLLLLALWLGVQALAPTRLRLWLLDAILWVSVAGLTFSAGLVYVQLAILHAVCPFCLASAGIVLAMVPMALAARRAIGAGIAGASRAGAWTMAGFAVFPALIFAAGGFLEEKSPEGLWLVDLATAHRLGPTDAPVQLVVYSDFQCDFCRKLVPVLQEIHGEFPEEVALCYRHFPLSVHPRAMAAAEASEAAAEQGSFWEYHDRLFAEGGDLSDARLMALAVSLGLDQGRFTTAFRSDRVRQVVERDRREAVHLGLPGAPSVFLNGRPVDGPLTRERLVKRIQELLKNSQS